MNWRQITFKMSIDCNQSSMEPNREFKQSSPQSKVIMLKDIIDYCNSVIEELEPTIKESLQVDKVAIFKKHSSLEHTDVYPLMDLSEFKSALEDLKESATSEKPTSHEDAVMERKARVTKEDEGLPFHQQRIGSKSFEYDLPQTRK